MIPKYDKNFDYNNSYGEKLIYEALEEQLSDDYTVIHSLCWKKEVKNNSNSYISSGEADFVLICPKGIIVFEVKSGGIELSGGKWIQTNTVTGERIELKMDPMRQADKSKYTLMEVLKTERDISIFSAVWFTSIDDEGKTLCQDLNHLEKLIFLKKDLDCVSDAINKVFALCNVIKKDPLSKESIEAITKKLLPEFEILPKVSVNINETNYVMNRMNDEQKILLEYLEANHTDVAMINGPAGTGKTIVALHMASSLASNGKVLYLCFNKLFLDALKKQIIDDNIHVYNMPGIAAKILNMDFVNEKKINQAILSNELKDYSSVIIDEAQDLYDSNIINIVNICMDHHKKLFIFYDDCQNVIRNDKMEWKKQILCNLPLRINCRSTESIANTAISRVDVHYSSSLIKGGKPNFHISCVEKFFNVLDTIIDNYINDGLSIDDIVILTLITENDSIINTNMNRSKYEFVNKYEKGKVFYTSVKKFKGMEAEVVIIIDLDFNFFNIDGNADLFYVAASRAKHFLDIVFIQENKIELFTHSLIGRTVDKTRRVIRDELSVAIKVHKDKNDIKNK